MKSLFKTQGVDGCYFGIPAVIIFYEAHFLVHLKEGTSSYVPDHYCHHGKYCTNVEYFLNKQERQGI